MARIDAARGDVPRSRFVQRAVEAALDGVESAEPFDVQRLVALGVAANVAATERNLRRGSESPDLESRLLDPSEPSPVVVFEAPAPLLPKRSPVPSGVPVVRASVLPARVHSPRCGCAVCRPVKPVGGS